MRKHQTAPAVLAPLRMPTWTARKIAAVLTAAAIAGGSLVTVAPTAQADTNTAATEVAAEETSAATQSDAPAEAPAEQTNDEISETSDEEAAVAGEQETSEESPATEEAVAPAEVENPEVAATNIQADEVPEVAEGFTRKTYTDGAYVDIPQKWDREGTTTITGGKWFGIAGDNPSVIALKFDAGAIQADQVVDPDAPDETVWAVIRPGADGTFSAEIEFPDLDNSALDEELAEGYEIEWFLLTGSLGSNDIARGGSAGKSTVTGPVRVTGLDQPQMSVCDFTFEARTIETGVNNGYQMTMNNVTGKAYFGDSQWRQESMDADGNVTVQREPSGKLVEFDVATGNKVRDIDFTHLTHANGDKSDADPVDWDSIEAEEDGSKAYTSMRSTFSPYGVAIDESTNTLITTTARQRSDEHDYGGGIVMFSADGEPTNADRIFEYEDGTPVLNGPRRIAVDSNNQRAYLHSLSDGRFGRSGMSSYITVLDTTKRGLDAVVAQIEIPRTEDNMAAGVIDMEVDLNNGNVYLGPIGGGDGHLMVINPEDIVESDPRTTSRDESWAQNDGIVQKLDAYVGFNARVTIDQVNQVLYANAWASPTGTITKVDIDPNSENYGKSEGMIHTGPTNQTAVDPTRGLLYSANLGDQEVVIFDAANLEVKGTVPTSGNALNIFIDDNGNAWVSNFADAGKAEIITPVAPDGVDCIITEPTDPTDPEPTDPTDPEPTDPTDPSDELPEVIEGYNRHTYADGAYVDIPQKWDREGTTTITGGKWFAQDEETPSVIALKLNKGGISGLEPAEDDLAVDIWAVIRPQADGTFSAEIEFPNPENSELDEELAEGAEIEWNLLTGSMLTGDNLRGGTAGISTVTGPVRVTSIDQPQMSVCDFTFDARTVETGVNNGYQMTLNNTTGKAYFGDSQWHQESMDADGNVTVQREPSGKLVEFDVATGEKIRDIDFTHLTHANGDKSDADPVDWDSIEAEEDGSKLYTSMRNTFSPYGAAIDESTNTLITTTARQRSDEHEYGGGIVMFDADQEAPTDADRIYEYEDGTPVLNGPRRIAVDSVNQRAYLHSLSDGRFGRSGMSSYITVLDTTKRGLDAVVAQIEVPRTEDDNAIGVIDMEVNLNNGNIYLGTMGAGDGSLMVIERDDIVESDPRSTSRDESWEQNAGVIKTVEAKVGMNARVTIDQVNQVLYANAWASPTGTITKVDIDPESDTYGESLGMIHTGPTNQTAVDPTRGLLYSANLGDQEVVIFDTGDLSVKGTVPTSGNALNIFIADDGNAWVSNFADAGKAEIITPVAPDGVDCIITEPTDPTDPEPTDPTDPEPTDPTDPEPTDPTDPEPTDPTDPEPTDPTDPEPTDPTDPEPTDPTDPEPTDPSDPADQGGTTTTGGKGGTGGGTGGGGSLAKTGASVGIIAALGGLLAAAGAAMTKRRRKGDEEA